MSHRDVRASSKQQAATKNNKWLAIKVIQRRDKKKKQTRGNRTEDGQSFKRVTAGFGSSESSLLQETNTKMMKLIKHPKKNGKEKRGKRLKRCR